MKKYHFTSFTHNIDFDRHETERKMAQIKRINDLNNGTKWKFEWL